MPSKHTRICVQCGTPFKPHRPSDPQRYCSRACGYTSRLRGEHRQCSCGCGTTIYVPASKLRASRMGQFYANAEHKYRHLVRENHPCWRGGATHYGPDWLAIAQAVRDRDGCCQHCGHVPGPGEKALEAHHVIPYRVVQRHDMDNLIALCGVCHGKVTTCEDVIYPLPYQRACMVCGEMFEPATRAHRICSEECRRENQLRYHRMYYQTNEKERERRREAQRRRRLRVRGPRPVGICVICDGEYVMPHGRAMTCSSECRAERIRRDMRARYHVKKKEQTP